MTRQDHQTRKEKAKARQRAERDCADTAAMHEAEAAADTTPPTSASSSSRDHTTDVTATAINFAVPAVGASSSKVGIGSMQHGVHKMPPPSKAGGASPWGTSSLIGAADQSATIEGLVQKIETLENKYNHMENILRKHGFAEWSS
jgi:hypothetical protein